MSISSALTNSISTTDFTPRTELDSHANMAVLGKHCFVFENSGRSCDVSAFSPTIEKTSLPIVDAVIVYDCPYTYKSYLLMIRNALYVAEMQHNLIPPFLLREHGIIVNECAKIHSISPTVADHSIFFPQEELQKPLKLNGIFSFFNHRIPHLEEIDHLKVLFLTPDSAQWDPNSSHFAEDEDAFLDDIGQMIFRPKKKTRFLIENEDEVDNTSIYTVTADPVTLPSYDQIDLAINANIASIEMAQMTYIEPSSSGAMNDGKSFADSLSATIGSVLANNTDHDDNLFSPDDSYQLDDLEKKFSAQISSAKAGKLKSISPTFLSKIWSINESQAQGAIDSNTHLNKQSGETSLSRHFSTNDRMLRYKRINSLFFTDTFFAKGETKSRQRGNTCMQIFVSDKGYVAVYPMKTKGQFKDCLHQFCKEIGVPQTLVMDKSGEQTSTAVKRFSHNVGLTLRILEESTQWANRAELYIGILKEAIRRDLRVSNCPIVLWDYCAERRALIHNLTPRALFQTANKTPTEATFGTQGDISNLCLFDWYDWCYYREDSDHQFPHQKILLGRVLGPSKNEGNEMAQNILNHKGNIVPRRTLRRLTASELNSPVEIKKRSDFDERIKSILGDALTIPPNMTEPEVLELQDFSDPDSDNNDDQPSQCLDNDPINDNGKPTFDIPVDDSLINAEVMLPFNNEQKLARVKGRSTDINGNLIGAHNSNPFLNTSTYDVEFSDHTVKQFGANVIAQNLYSQVDSTGRSQRLLANILDSQRDHTAVPKSDMYITTSSGQQRMRKSTIGWKLLVQWNDGSQEWLPLKLLKELYPAEVADFAVSTEIDREPAFAFWVKHVLKKRNMIISAAKARVPKMTHKYGIEVPTSVTHAQEIDKRNKTTHWMDALRLEMDTIRILPLT